MISTLGLRDVRSSRLVLFSRQYAESVFNTRKADEQLPWSPVIAPVKSPKRTLPTDLTSLQRESIHPFAGVGDYAMDSFAIYSPLLPGGGAPRDEAFWLEDSSSSQAGSQPSTPVSKRSLSEVSFRDDSEDAWRKVIPKGNDTF